MSELKDTELYKPELCAKIAERSGLPLRAVNRMFDTFIEVILEEVSQGKTVNIRRIGKFYAQYFTGGQSRKHPMTGKVTIQPGKWRPCFRFGETFKRLVKQIGGELNG